MEEKKDEEKLKIFQIYYSIPIQEINYKEDDDSSFELSDPKDPWIYKFATVNKLIATYTSKPEVSSTILTEFLSTYKSCFKTNQLLDELFQRFNLVPENLDFTEEFLKKLLFTREKVVEMICILCENYYQDDIKNEKEKKLLKWMEEIKNVKYGDLYVQMIEKKIKLYKSNKSIIDETEILIERTEDLTEELLNKFMGYSSVEIARELSLISYELFFKIHRNEILKKEDIGTSKTINIYNYSTGYSLNIYKLFKNIIFFNTNENEMVQRIEKIIEIASTVKRLDNYGGLVNIISALLFTAVGRLTNIFEKVNPKYIIVLKRLERVVTSDNGYKNYKESLKLAKRPCIPYLSRLIHDIKRIYETCPSDNKNMKNIHKCHLLYKKLETIRYFQEEGYDFKSNIELRGLLLKIKPFDNEEEFFKISYEILPKIKK